MIFLVQLAPSNVSVNEWLMTLNLDIEKRDFYLKMIAVL